MKKIIAVILISFTLVSCGTGKKNSALYGKKDDAKLNAQWFLKDENGDNVTGLRNMPITLEMHAEDGHNANGFAGCNQYGTSFSLNGASLSFANTYSAKKSCPDLKVEQNYFSALEEVNNYKIEGNNLYLYKDKLLLLHFKK